MKNEVKKFWKKNSWVNFCPNYKIDLIIWQISPIEDGKHRVEHVWNLGSEDLTVRQLPPPPSKIVPRRYYY